MGAKIGYHELVRVIFEIGDIRIYTHYLNHLALTLGYCLEADGCSVACIFDMDSCSMDTSFSKGQFSPEEQSILDFIRHQFRSIHG